MNETNLSEARLRSWQPRRPSPRLKKRIFDASELPSLPDVARIVRWLTPAAACVLLAVATSRQTHTGDGGVMIRTTTTHETSASAGAPAEGNRVSPVTLAFTNFNSGTSGMSSVIPAGIN